MSGFLTPKVEGLLAKLGAASGLIPMALSYIKVKLADGDAEAVSARFVELEEFADRLKEFAQKGRNAVADNALSGSEVVDLLEDMDVLADELQDVFTGIDEDDPTDQPT